MKMRCGGRRRFRCTCFDDFDSSSIHSNVLLLSWITAITIPVSPRNLFGSLRSSEAHGFKRIGFAHTSHLAVQQPLELGRPPPSLRLLNMELKNRSVYHFNRIKHHENNTCHSYCLRLNCKFIHVRTDTAVCSRQSDRMQVDSSGSGYTRSGIELLTLCSIQSATGL